MKQQPGKNMAIFGSGSIVSTFMQLGLIDEYRIIVDEKGVLGILV
jgi:dihydrofolate reductase